MGAAGGRCRAGDAASSLASSDSGCEVSLDLLGRILEGSLAEATGLKPHLLLASACGVHVMVRSDRAAARQDTGGELRFPRLPVNRSLCVWDVPAGCKVGQVTIGPWPVSDARKTNCYPGLCVTGAEEIKSRRQPGKPGPEPFAASAARRTS